MGCPNPAKDLGICHTEEDPNKGRKTFLVSCQYHALDFGSVISANEFDIAQALGFPLCILMGYRCFGVFQYHLSLVFYWANEFHIADFRLPILVYFWVMGNI